MQLPRCLPKKGFHRATIKDIARVAGIADGTIYTYFASKTEVLLGILHRLNESTEREQQLTPESGQDLRSFFTAYLRQRIVLVWPNTSCSTLYCQICSSMRNCVSCTTGKCGAHLHRRRTLLAGTVEQDKHPALMWLSRLVLSPACSWDCSCSNCSAAR